MKAHRMPRFGKLLGLVALGTLTQAVAGQSNDGSWSPARAPSVVATSYPGPQPQPTPAASLGVPVSLGRPRAVAETTPLRLPRIQEPIQTTSYGGATVPPPHPTYRGQAPDVPPPPPGGGGGSIALPGSGIPPAPGTEPYNQGLVGGGQGPGFWDNVKGFCCPDNFGRFNGFQSDHCEFDYFSSPVSNPFLAEDPRALTEAKLLFFWQTIPDDNPVYGGGNAYFYGLQGRVAITERLSIVMNKLGGVTMSPSQELPGFEDESGFAEVWIGPKYTFLRDECNGRVAAAGMTFQIPVGSSTIQQDTGNLTIAPYLSFAQTFGRTSYGAFNFMTTAGYAFSTDSARSDYFYTQFHLDFDVLAWHKFYPFMEFNWIRNTTQGNARPALTFEGGDLINYGAGSLQEDSYTSLAGGLRYKFSETFQMGVAAEMPLSSRKDIQDFRLLFDFIIRY